MAQSTISVEALRLKPELPRGRKRTSTRSLARGDPPPDEAAGRGHDAISDGPQEGSHRADRRTVAPRERAFGGRVPAAAVDPGRVLGAGGQRFRQLRRSGLRHREPARAGGADLGGGGLGLHDLFGEQLASPDVAVAHGGPRPFRDESRGFSPDESRFARAGRASSCFSPWAG